MLHLIFNKKTVIVLVVGLALVLGFIFNSYGETYKAGLRESFTAPGYTIEGPSLIISGIVALKLFEQSGEIPPSVCLNNAQECVQNFIPNEQIRSSCNDAVIQGDTHYNSVMSETTIMLGLNKFLFETQNLIMCQDREYCLVENDLDFYNAVSSNRSLRNCLNALNTWSTNAVIQGNSQDDIPVLPDQGEDLTFYEINSEQINYFSETIQNKFINEVAQPIEGFTPEMFMRVYPDFVNNDFDMVEAFGGVYKDGDSGLEFQSAVSRVITSADNAISQQGMETLLRNVSSRFAITITDNESVDRVIEQLE